MKPFALSVLLLLPSISTAIECVTSKCYADVYGDVDPTTTSTLSRVEGIYRKLTRTVGTQQAVRSKLMIINSNGFPWAVALGDNTVVVTTGAIERLYRERDLVLGDARAAFMLGHELSHLATDDLFHHSFGQIGSRGSWFHHGRHTRHPIDRALFKHTPDREVEGIDVNGHTFLGYHDVMTHELTTTAQVYWVSIDVE